MTKRVKGKGLENMNERVIYGMVRSLTATLKRLADDEIDELQSLLLNQQADSARDLLDLLYGDLLEESEGGSDHD